MTSSLDSQIAVKLLYSNSEISFAWISQLAIAIYTRMSNPSETIHFAHVICVEVL